MKRRFAAGYALLAVLMLAGCAGYHLGPSNGNLAGAHSIQIEPFVNQTTEPRLVDYVMNSLRKSLQQDGTYRLATHDAGDVIVAGEITSYTPVGLSVQPTDVLTVVDYQITMTVRITARDRATGKVLFDKPVKGRTTLRAGQDLTSAERQAIPLLAEDFAKNATDLLGNVTW